MNKEKIDLSKPKKEYKKFQKESESLVDELKIDKEEQDEEILEEEMEARFWENLYKEKLEEVLGDKEFKRSAISDLEDDIKSGKGGDGFNANWVFGTISIYKNLGIFDKEAEENLKEILNDEKFKNAAISDLEDNIKSGKGSDGYQANGYNANWALKIISIYKNLGIFDRETEEDLKEILGYEKFKRLAISALEGDIKLGKDDNGDRANWALEIISSYKNLGIFEIEVEESLKEVLGDKDFKNVAIHDLENDIKSGKNSFGNRANWALWNILTYKNVSDYYQELAEKKKAKQAREKDKGESIPKRPEIK